MEIRKLFSLEDFEKAVQAQKDIWGMQDRDLVPSNLMLAMKDYAQQWACFADGEIAALALVYPTNEQGVYLFHMLGAVPKHRGALYAIKLLASVRDHSKKAGAKKFVWTYDPFDFTNSRIYLNLAKAIGTGAVLNYYGVINSQHHGALPSHRLLCELDLTQEYSFHCDEKRLPMPATAEELRKPAAKNSEEILNKWFVDLGGLIKEGYVACGFEASPDKKTGAIILKKRK